MVTPNQIIDEDTIREAAEAILRAAPGSKVIVFGSYARGDARPGSDLDFLVIELDFENVLHETARLREVVHPILRSWMIPVDILLASKRTFDYWRETPNTVYYEADRRGKTYEPTD